MDEKSIKILLNIETFIWTLTSDGKDYIKDGLGCGNPNSSSEEVNNAWSMGKKKGHNCAVRLSNGKHIFPNSKEVNKISLKIGK